MPTDWYPTQEAKRRLFRQNLVDNIGDVTTLVKLPAGTFKEATGAAQAGLDFFGTRDAAPKALDTAQHNLVEQEALTATTVRAGVKQIKSPMNVPAEVLNLLETSTTPAKPAGRVAAGRVAAGRVAAGVPVLRPKMDGIHPSIGCVKHGYDAVQIWGCRTGEKGFTQLATLTHLPYFDNRPNHDPALAGQRDCYAYYLKKNGVASAQDATYTLLVPGGRHAQAGAGRKLGGRNPPLVRIIAQRTLAQLLCKRPFVFTGGARHPIS